MSTFPSVISTISDPAATDKLNTPSHSTIETAQNDGIKKLETFIGTLSSAVGTIMYDIRATASDGGGHVQGANKGGTGQTAFTKGDVLVANSASVLSKLAVGSNDQALVADSAQAAGVKWSGVATAAQIQNQTYIYARASVMSGSVYGVKLSENPSILSDGLGLVIKFPAAPTSSAMALQVFTSSSGSVAARIKKTDLTDPDTTDITASMIGVLEFDSVSSVFQLVNPLDYVNLISAQSVLGVKVFGSIPQTAGGNPVADTQLARKAYVDTKVDLSSTESVAGVKTFSSIPILPSSDPTTDNQASRKAYVDSFSSTYKVGTTTYDLSTASGAQTIAHGLGKTPKFIKIEANFNGVTQTTYKKSSGMYNGTTQVCINEGGAMDGNISSYGGSGYIIEMTDVNRQAYQNGVASWDATNITITWTKTASPTGTANIIWEAYA